MKLTIKTNNRPRDIVRWWDLTEKERKEFDYLDSEQRQLDAEFFRYRGVVYDLGEFQIIPRNCNWEGCEKWSGYISDSFFSGILIRYANDFEQVICATYFS
jgi:hypothetical protein